MLFCTLAYLFRDSIKDRVVQELNGRLRTEVKVAEIELSLFERFPRMAIAFNEVTAYGYGTPNDTLLHAEKLFLELNTFSLIRGQYTIDQVVISNGGLHIDYRQDGNSNYLIFKPSEFNDENVNLEFSSIVLIESDLLYTDLLMGQSLKTYCSKASIGAKIEKGTRISLDIEAVDPVWKQKQDEWSLSGPSQWKGKLRYYGDTLELSSFELSRKKLKVAVSGSVIGSNPHLRFETKGADLEDLKEALPSSLASYLEEYQMLGKLEFQGSLIETEYTFFFSLYKSSMKHVDLPVSLDRIDLSGTINGDTRFTETAELMIDKMELFTSAGMLKGTLGIKNFLKPLLRFHLEGDIDLEEVMHVLNAEMIADMSGTASMNISFENSFNGWDWESKDFRTAKSSGGIQISNGHGRMAQYEQDFDIVKAELTYDDRNLNIDELRGTAGSSDFSFKGHFENVWQYLLLPDTEMYLDAVFQSENLYLDEWLSTESSSETFAMHIENHLNYHLELEVDNFRFTEFNAADLRGSMTQYEGKIEVEKLSLNSCKGSFDGNLKIVSDEANNLHFSSISSLRKMEIKEIFTSFGDFGQSTLRSEHINGLGDADIAFYGQWSENLKVDLSSIKVTSTVRIKGGQLKGFEPLEYLSDYVDIAALKHVRFSDLQNTIIIENEVIEIPEMEVRSSALNFGASGHHSFNNIIDYVVRLELTDVLLKEKKLENPEMEDYLYVEDDGMAPNLYLRMTGDVYDPVIKYDLKAAGKDVAKDWQKEKKEIKAAWNSSFSKDSTKTDPDEGPRYELEWNDSTDIDNE